MQVRRKRIAMLEEIIETLTELNIWSVAFRILLALILGGCIGLERGYHGRAAGLRTHILVCLGAALAAMTGVYEVRVLGFSADPLRVAAQVISGIGFLGVGTIIVRNRSQVTGLTTAAGLWATGSIGIAIGIGFYIAAILAFLIVFLTITLLIHLEKKSKKSDTNYCYVELSDAEKTQEFCDIAMQYASKIEVIPAKSGLANHVGIEFKSKSPGDFEALLLVSRENSDVMVALPVQY